MSVPDILRQGLSTQRSRYGAILDNTDIGFCVLEILHDAQGTATTPTTASSRPIRPSSARPACRMPSDNTARALVPNLEQAWVDTYAAIDARREATRFESGSEAMGRWFEVYAFPVDEPALHRVGLLFNDISARRAAEGELRRSEEQFRVFAQAMPNQVWAARADGFVDCTTKRSTPIPARRPARSKARAAWAGVLHTRRPAGQRPGLGAQASRRARSTSASSACGATTAPSAGSWRAPCRCAEAAPWCAGRLQHRHRRHAPPDRRARPPQRGAGDHGRGAPRASAT